MARRYAAADIGSNTVHLLVAERLAKGGLKRLINDSEWLSLGEAVARQGFISEEQATRLMETLREFKRRSAALGAPIPYVFATEAMRAARNHHQVLGEIRRTLGIKVDLIPPVREAALSALGVSLDVDVSIDTVLIEVGGGSAQIARICSGTMLDEFSLPIGTGRLIAEFELTQPADERSVIHLHQTLAARLSNCRILPGLPLVASGGVARGLIRALHPDGDPVIYAYELEYLIQSVMQLPEDIVGSRFRVKPKRALTLLPGASVYLMCLRHFRADHMRVSEFGVREGAVLEQIQQEVVVQ